MHMAGGTRERCGRHGGDAAEGTGDGRPRQHPHVLVFGSVLALELLSQQLRATYYDRRRREQRPPGSGPRGKVPELRRGSPRAQQQNGGFRGAPG